MAHEKAKPASKTSKTRLRELARELRALAAGIASDRELEQRRDEWLVALNALHTSVERWVAPLVKAKSLAIKHDTVPLEEDGLVAYTAPKLRLVVQRRVTIRLVPRGAIIQAARGRVDMVCRHKSELMILDDDDKWMFARRRIGLPWSLTPVKKESFLASIVELLHDD